MPRKSQKTKFVDRWTGISLRLKGRLKNEIIEHAAKRGVSVNELVLYAVWDFIQNEKGIPSAGSAQYSLPTAQEEIAAYLRGETLLQPCGKKDCTKKITQIDSMQFCTVCNLRIL